MGDAQLPAKFRKDDGEYNSAAICVSAGPRALVGQRGCHIFLVAPEKLKFERGLEGAATRATNVPVGEVRIIEMLNV